MAVNKNALIRYHILDRCFRNSGRSYTLDDLQEEINRTLRELYHEEKGISRRQLFMDLQFMESSEGYAIELERSPDGKKKNYRYTNSAFSIHNMPLNDTEIQHLEDALNILSHFRGMPQFEWVHELIPKLQNGLKTQPEGRSIIDFDHNPYLKGIEHLGELYQAILYKKVLRISYHPFLDAEPHELILHPYYLKQYNSRWFLFGYNPATQLPDWNLALDRIVCFSVCKDVYVDNEEIDWSEYFDDIIGVTRPENGTLEKITLHVKGKTGHYIATKPLHGSQKSKWLNADTLEVRLNLIVNYELERLLLSYLDALVVVQPQGLRERIRERVANFLGA